MKNSVLISVLSLVLSIIACVGVWFNPKRFELDVFNSVITILTLLVTILIGWQIWQSININYIRREILQEKESFNEEKNRMMSLLYFEIALTYYERVEVNGSARWVYSFEFNIIKSAYYAVKCCNVEVLDLLNEKLSSVAIPLVGRSKETEDRRFRAINEFSNKELKILRSYPGIESYFIK